MKKLISILVIMLMFATTFVIAETTTDNDTNQQSPTSLDPDWWSMLYHDAQRSGFSTSEGPDANTVLWESLNLGFSTSPIVADGIVYSAGFGTLFAYNAYTGEQLKEFDEQTNAPIAVSEGKIYVVLTNKNIVCLDAENNWIQVWIQSEAIDGDSSFYSPILSEGRLYIAYMNSDLLTTNISCLNIDNGTVIWESSLGTPSLSDIAISEGNVYATASRDLFCIDATDGSLSWQTTVLDPGDQFVGITPAISNGMLYTISMNGKVLGLNLTNSGAVDWEYDTGDTANFIGDSPSLAYGRLYVGTATNLYCFDLSSPSAPEWIYNHNNMAAKTPIVADEKVYVNQDGLRCLDAIGNGDGTTTLLWSFASASTVCPAIAEGVLYLVSNSKLYSFNEDQYPEIPTVMGDSQANKNEPYSLFVNTTDPDNDSIFYLVNWDDDTGQQTFGPYPSGEEQEITHIYRKPHTEGIKTFDIRAKAQENTPFLLESEAVHHFISVENHKPDAPDVHGPTMALVDEEFNMEINITDPDGDIYLALRRKVEPIGGWTAWTGNYNSGETVTLPFTIHETGSYTLQFQVGERGSYDGMAIYAKSNISEWSIEIVDVAVEIGDVTAGFGVINAEIVESKGQTDAENVQWTIDVDGGVFDLVHVEAGDVINEIPAGGTEIVSTEGYGKFFGYIFGLGPIDIHITAICDGMSEPVSKNMQANLLGPIILNL